MKYKIIIPARGGSKRFPKKNIALLDGIPLIYHSILFAQNLDFIKTDDIIVNTDCIEIATLVKKINCKVYNRPKKLGSDTSSTAEVLKEQVINMLREGENFDAIILLQPTNPFRTKSLVLNAINLFEMNRCKSLVSYSILNRKFGEINCNTFRPYNYDFGQRMQDIKKFYFENGSIYITLKDELIKGNIITEDVYPYVDNHPFSSIDIDEKVDLFYAEFLIKNKILYE
jgi:N-acylneuraminate cytidylyltransferase